MSDKPSPGNFQEHYTLKEKVGKGAYAEVFKCTRKDSGTIYAVKVVDKSKTGPKDVEDLSHEIKVMSAVGYHPHVVQMIEYFSTPHHLYIVLDYLDGGMLFDRIVQMKHYSEMNASGLIRNLLSALSHLHARNIIHRDLKPENLLLRHNKASAVAASSKLTDVCLADFGLAGYIPSTACCGSPSYIAPEVISVGYYQTRTTPYDSKCDIWSLGVITYILLTGKMPFHGATFKETFKKITTNSWEYPAGFKSTVSSSAVDFINSCLTLDPIKRPSAKVLLNHPWVAEEQSDTHLEGSLECLKTFNTQEKIRAAVRVFCWTQNLLGHMDRTPPFMRYLRHPDTLSTIIYHQSQTDTKVEHEVDYSFALQHGRPGWRLQDCCTCASELICRHIQNVHEYLFVGCRSMDVYPLINQLRMTRLDAEEDLAAERTGGSTLKVKTLQENLRKIIYVIDAACTFSDELAKIPADLRKPNLMIDGSRNLLFRERGGSRGAISGLIRTAPNDKDPQKAAANRMARAYREQQHQERGPETLPASSKTGGPTAASVPSPSKRNDPTNRRSSDGINRDKDKKPR